MKPQNHSRIFSPSKSMLWLECYQSVLFNDGNNSETNEQAEFGTETHELAAATISNSLNVEDFDGNSAVTIFMCEGSIFRCYDFEYGKQAKAQFNYACRF